VALELAAEQMKWYYDKNVQKVPFKVRDQVMLDLKDYQKSRHKFAAQRYGPFKIIEKLSPVTFKLEWPEQLQAIHSVFHASKLIPYCDVKFKGQQFEHPLPDVVDGIEQYEVETILRSQQYGHERQKKQL
jgi:hypothetical protein